jgi:CheY-like chemotaxis protein
LAKQSLLLVDGDVKSLRVLEVSLKKAGYNVTTAATGQDALDKVQTAQPDLIISDTDMPGMNGFEFCRHLQENPEWAVIPFIFLTGQTSIEHKIKGLELGVEEYLTKPIYIKEILTRVKILLQKTQRVRIEEKRDSRTRFSGALSDMGVVDLIQTIDVSRKSGLVHVTDDRGTKGTLFFRAGKVVDAELSTLQGEDAVYRLLTWSDGEFEFVFRNVRRKDNIEMSSQGLLMEGMRRLDEWGRLLEQLPPLDSRFEVDYSELADRLAELPDELNSILRLFDGVRTLMEVIDACEYGDLEALTVISKLYFEGLIIESQQELPSAELADGLAEPPPLAPPPAAGPLPGSSVDPDEVRRSMMAQVATTDDLRDTVPTESPEVAVPRVGLPPLAEGEGYTEHAIDDDDLAAIDENWEDESTGPEEIPISASEIVDEHDELDDGPAPVEIDADDAFARSPAAAGAPRSTLRGMRGAMPDAQPGNGELSHSEVVADATPIPPPAPGLYTPVPPLPNMVVSHGADRHEVSGELAIPPLRPLSPPSPSERATILTSGVVPVPVAASAAPAARTEPPKSAVMQAIEDVALEPLEPELDVGLATGPSFAPTSSPGAVTRPMPAQAPTLDPPPVSRPVPAPALALDPPPASRPMPAPAPALDPLPASRPLAQTIASAALPAAGPDPARPPPQRDWPRPPAEVISTPSPPPALDRPAVRPSARLHDRTDAPQSGHRRADSTVTMAPVPPNRFWAIAVAGSITVGLLGAGAMIAFRRDPSAAVAAGTDSAAAAPDAALVAVAKTPADAAPVARVAPPDAAPATPVAVVAAPTTGAASERPSTASSKDNSGDPSKAFKGHFSDALRAYRRGNYDEALAAVDRALEAKSSAQAFDLKANILLGLRRPDEAKQAAATAVRKGASRARHWLTKGMIHYELKEYADARAALQTFLELDPVGPYADDVRDLLDSM